MDPDRVRAYLQVACAGLGFDIGEIWWSSNEAGSTALAAIEDQHDDNNSTTITNGKKMRFVQLYTSRSYENRRNQLVTPADEEENYVQQINGDAEEESNERPNNIVAKKHVLSPLLVDAISKTAQVVWAHTKKQEGLTGRSDMRLQTAVGMPVAIDGNGNMCVVVMFSPNNISSTDDALEYLQSISRSATSTSIPSLLPAFDPRQGLVSLPHHHDTNEIIPLLTQPSMADGSVITRFVSLDDAPVGGGQLHVPEVHSNHELVNAPKDCFGIPMLPSVTMLDTNDGAEAFDEASYGVWSTIMENADQQVSGSELLDTDNTHLKQLQGSFEVPEPETASPIYAINRPTMEKDRLDRLEEFAAAFLDVSVFDCAEVWVPIGEQAGYLGQVTSIVSSDSKSNQSLQDFEKTSEKVLIKFWSGAVGRAFSSGNPVWSANQDVFADTGRLGPFAQAKIETALAVPVFSGKATSPSFVFSCYSFVRTGSVPFVLKFVQQALRLLWDGLDKVQPHKSVGENLWRDVAPADLGEMAADVEMQQHFMIKKRPHAAIEAAPVQQNAEDSVLTSGFKAMSTPSGIHPVRSIYTGTLSGVDEFSGDDYEPNVVLPIQYQHIQHPQSLIRQAVQSVGNLKPMHEPMHERVATNDQGSKRAHIFIERLDSPVEFETSSLQESEQAAAPMTSSRASGAMNTQSPLPMPRPLPLPNASLRQPLHAAVQAGLPRIHPLQNQSPGFMQQTTHLQAQNYDIQNQHQAYNAPGTLQQYQPQTHVQQGHHTDQTSNEMQYALQGQFSSVGQPSYGMHYNQTPSQDTDPQSNHMQYTQQGNVSTAAHGIPYTQHQYHSPVTTTYQSTVTATGMAFSQQHLMNAQPQQLQQNMPSSEPLSLPSEYNPSAYQNSDNLQTSIPQTTYGSIPTSKISATGMVFHAPTASQAIQPPQTMNGMGQGFSTGTSGSQFCQVVDPASMTDARTGRSGGKPCRIQGCKEPAVSRRPYCAGHSGNRMCEHPTCNKCAQGSTRFCIAHGGGRRCTFPGCDKGARDKFFCAAHGGGKRCRQDGCDKSAVGGSQYCTAHGGGRRCSVDGCDKSAQSSTRFCVKHGGGKKCAQDGCDKVARGRTQYCAAHGGGVRCKLAGCNRVAIGKAQLCRAHGGGTRPRKSNGGDMFGGGIDDEDHDDEPADQSIPGFADMATI